MRTITLFAAPLGSMLPGRPADWEELPPDARAWADRQAAQENEMLTVLDGDHRARFQDFDIYVTQVGP